MNVTRAVREFSFMGVRLPDPNASLSPEEVKAAYATQYPELATASINGPEAVGDKLKYEFVRALDTNARPEAGTQIMTAPYWNVAGDSGRVCLGTVRPPDRVSVDSMASWERAFFQSEFTHPWGAARLTSHPGGFIGLWESLRGKKKFSGRYLTDARQTLRRFITQER